MAKVVEDHWQGPISGLVVTRSGYSVPCRQIEIIEAAHPVPDANSMAAASAMLRKVAGLTDEDHVLCLASGGGSSLLSLPIEGLDPRQKQLIHASLIASGASISEINCVRRHLSAIKGGRLAAACHPAKLTTLMMSDVPGDRPVDIASGPTIADPTTCADALDIVDRYGIDLPSIARAALENGSSETVKPGDPRIAGNVAHLVTTPRQALLAAAVVAENAGYKPVILGDRIEGEAREVAKVMAGITHSIVAHRDPIEPPCVLLSGGETAVTVRGSGRGGRNVEFLLSLAIALDGLPGVHALAGDTDGVDGAEEVAGAHLAPDSLIRARAVNIDPAASLARNDGHGFFQGIGDQIVTGPTLTNVNDFRAIVISGEAP
jgi:hydroxypyruvate reductase